MEKIRLGQTDLMGSRLAYGCMRISGDGSSADREKGKAAIRAALDAGYTVFDHADIYGAGACEDLFGEMLMETPTLRDEIILIGKCGVRLGDVAVNHYDLSRKHIVTSVEASLGRLQTEQLDFLLLHRPDYLADLHEIAGAFDELHASGKVANFGVSNFSPSLVSSLQSVTDHRLHINQVEINIHHVAPFTDGTLDQCQAEAITPQAWCPIAGVAYEPWGSTFTAEQSARIRAEVDRQAAEYGVRDWQIAFAWLLRHPAAISPIVGSTTPERIAAAVEALSIEYSREDWYRLLEARNGEPVP